MNAGEGDLSALDDWFGRILSGLSPAKRRNAARRLGQALRRFNLKRQQMNVEPDGSAMESRKPRLDRRGDVRRKAGGRMFRRLRYARNWSIDAQADSVEISLASGAAAKLAAEHHFGLKGFVGRDHSGKRIEVKYPARRLLGFSRQDRETTIEIAADLFDTPARG